MNDYTFERGVRLLQLALDRDELKSFPPAAEYLETYEVAYVSETKSTGSPSTSHGT